MSYDNKIRLGIFVLGAAALALGAIAFAHGFHIPLLDEIGGAPH